MKYIAVIETGQKPVSCDFIGYEENEGPFLIGTATDIKEVKENKITTYQNAVSVYAALKDSAERVIDTWDTSAYHVITDMAVNDDGTVWTAYEFCTYDERPSETFTFPVEWLEMNDEELKAAIAERKQADKKFGTSPP